MLQLKKFVFPKRFRTFDGLLLILTIWMDKVLEERENVQKTFNDLRIYIDNFKPITQIKAENRDKMLKFLHQAYECHLKVKNGDEDEEVIQLAQWHVTCLYLTKENF